MIDALREKIEARTARVGDCLVYLSSPNKKGSKQIKVSRHAKPINVDRTYYCLVTGETLDPGKLLLKSCKTPNCIEPAHRYQIKDKQPERAPIPNVTGGWIGMFTRLIA